MAEEHQHQHTGEEAPEVKDRGLFDFMAKKKEGEESKKCEEEDALAAEVHKAKIESEVEEDEKKEEKHGLLDKLHRSNSSSSSSSDDEEEEGGEGETKDKKKKKKKGLKEKLHEKVGGAEKKDEAGTAVAVEHEDTSVPVEKVEDAEEKKGFLEKIKEKLPGGQHKKPGEEGAVAAPPPPTAPACEEHGVGKDQHAHEGESPKEKKGLLGKIMDKIPGYHKNDSGEQAGAPPAH